MIKINSNSFYLLTLAVLLCLPCFVIPIGGKLLLMASLFMLMSFVIAIYKDYKNFLYSIKVFCKNKYTRLFVAFILWAIFASFILILFGKTTVAISVSHIFFGLIYSVTFPLFFGFFIARKIHINKIMKVLYLSLYIIVIIGIINFIIFYFNINFLKQIYWFFVNIQTIRDSINPRNIQFMGLPRVRSVFYEPGVYSYFLALVLPFIYYFCQSKYRYIKNTYLDKFIKMTFIPFAWFNVIFSFSPMGIIMSGLSSIIYYFSKINNIKKLLKIVVSTVLVLLLIFLTIDKNNALIDKILLRILSVQYIFTDFEQFKTVEESLATRLVYYINCTIIGLKNIFFGVGWGHLGLSLKEQLLNSPIPLTYENIFIYFIQGQNTTSYVLAIAYAVFGATGLLGFVLFYSFIIRIAKKLFQLKKISLRYSNLFFVYIILFVLYSFYESPMYYQYFWLIIGIIASYIDKNKYIKLNKEEICH